jgi:hypothetical protein
LQEEVFVLSAGRLGLLFTDVIVHGLVVCSSKTVAQREHVADDGIVRWLFEESDGDSDQ